LPVSLKFSPSKVTICRDELPIQTPANQWKEKKKQNILAFSFVQIRLFLHYCCVYVEFFI